MSRAVTVAAGSKLGQYEIVAPFGAGGIGEAYRARDSRLSRDGAVNVLSAAIPAARGDDPSSTPS